MRLIERLLLRTFGKVDKCGVDCILSSSKKSATCATDSSDSYLRKFEEEVASDLGMEDAVFMPSGVMAQSIALLIHSQHDTESRRKRFACHHSSHILLHEENGYRELLNMEPLVINTANKNNGFRVRPVLFSDVKAAFEQINNGSEEEMVSTLVLELPHRELGGKLTPWEDVLQIRQLCDQKGAKFHCDGARLFEAGAGYGYESIAMCFLFLLVLFPHTIQYYGTRFFQPNPIRTLLALRYSLRFILQRAGWYLGRHASWY